MVDQRDLSAEKRWLGEERAKAVVASLQKRGANAVYVPTRQEALSLIMGMIPEGVTVVRGDSVTLEQVGVVDELKKRNKNKFIDPFEFLPDGTFAIKKTRERMKLQREAFTADAFLTGANAVTLDGKLVNTDGMGNRVAPMIFGPEKVIVAAGVNKIVRDIDEALARIHEVAAPVNAKRHVVKHEAEVFKDLPCVRTGKCYDCRNNWRICNYTVIMEGFARPRERMNVVLIGEELGI